MFKDYRVAEHDFRIILPDDRDFRPLLVQYEPFEAGTVTQALFILEMVDSLDAEAVEMLYRDEAPDEGQTGIEIYRTAEGFVLACIAPARGEAPKARVLFSPDYCSARFCCSDEDFLFALNNALMLQFAFATAPLKTLELHASVVVNGGRAYLFLGPSGSGKSTHSRLWIKNIEGGELLNDDNPLLRIMDDGSVRIYGSPWSGKFPCYRNLSFPAAAFVRIKQAPANRAVRLGILESYATLYSSVSGLKNDRAMASNLHRSLEKTVLEVPCFNMECLPDDDAARICAAAVRDNVRGSGNE